MNILLQVNNNNNNNNNNRNPPNHLICPISQVLFVDPVTTVSGHTYSREAIETWFRTHDTDPLSNTRVASKALTPNFAIRAVVEAYNTEH